jgi:hypothetical protein
MSLIAKVLIEGTSEIEIEIAVIPPGMTQRPLAPAKGNYVVKNMHRIAVPRGSPWQTLKYSLENHETRTSIFFDKHVLVPHEDYVSIQRELCNSIVDKCVIPDFFLGEMR